jgi:hypothetical protein
LKLFSEFEEVGKQEEVKRVVQKPKTTPIKAKQAELNKSNEVEKPRRFSKKVSKNDLNISGIEKSYIKHKKNDLDTSNVERTGVRINKSTTNLQKQRSVTPSRAKHLTEDKIANKKDNSFINSKMVIKRDPSHSIFKTRANDKFFKQNQSSDGVNLVLKSKEEYELDAEDREEVTERIEANDEFNSNDIEIITPVDRYKHDKESHRVEEILSNREEETHNNDRERIETKHVYNKPTIYEEVQPVTYSPSNHENNVNTKYKYGGGSDKTEITNKQTFDKHIDAPRRDFDVQILAKERVVNRPAEQTFGKKEPDISELLKQMKMMSDKQLLLIDSIEKIQDNTKEQFDFMSNRINKLENTVSYLVNYIQNIKKDSSTGDIESCGAKSNRNVFDLILSELKVYINLTIEKPNRCVYFSFR